MVPICGTNQINMCDMLKPTETFLRWKHFSMESNSMYNSMSDSCIYSFLFVCFLLFWLVFFFFAKTCEPWGSGVNWTCYFVSCCLLSFSQRAVISRSNLNRSASSNHGSRSGIWHFEPYVHVFRERCGRCLKATNQWRLCNTKAHMLSRSALNMFWSCRL